MENNHEDIHVSKERGGGGAQGTRAEIPKQDVPLQGPMLDQMDAQRKLTPWEVHIRDLKIITFLNTIKIMEGSCRERHHLLRAGLHALSFQPRGRRRGFGCLVVKPLVCIKQRGLTPTTRG